MSDLNKVSYLMKESLTAFSCSPNYIDSLVSRWGTGEGKEGRNALMLKPWIPQKPPVMKLITEGEISERILVVYIRDSENRSGQSNQCNLLKHL